MNLGGMVNAAPAVIRHLEQKPMETVAEYAAKHGQSAHIFPGREGQTYGIWDMSKIIGRAFKVAMNPGKFPARMDDIAHAVTQGSLSPEVAEFHRAFATIESKNSWEKFWLGDKYHEAAPGLGGKVKAKLYERGVEGWLSILSDSSENFSRFWGHSIGLEMADQLGIVGAQARHDFSRSLADKMIANYSPQNRPEVFQGTIGASIGLFTSFIQAYYQRLFRYIETGDGRALATQYGMQAGLFGVKTVPGWAELNSLLGDTNEDVTPYDSIFNRFGAEAGSAIMGGAIGSLPMIFGQEGLDLTSRGDTSYRTPVINPIAIYATGKKMIQGIGHAIDLFSSEHPELAGRQVAEILSNSIPNRPMAGIIEALGAGGKDTDNTGQVVSETKNLLESAYRMMGGRSMRQSQEVEAFYGNKRAMEEQAGRQDVLRRETRARMRSGEKADSMQDVFDTYVENGGDPRYYKRWIRDNYKSAVETRSERQLEAAMKSPARQAQAQRLLNARVGLAQEREEPEVDDATYGVQDSMDNEQPTARPDDNAELMYGEQPASASFNPF
jgi:hypothetical protein